MSCTVFESKLTAVGFGFFVPFFFITSGLEFNLDALGSAEAIAKLVMFFGLFLVVRGLPAMLLYRDVLRRPRPRGARLLLRDRAAAGRRDHDDRDRRRQDALLDRGRAWSAPRCSRPWSTHLSGRALRKGSRGPRRR